MTISEQVDQTTVVDPQLADAPPVLSSSTTTRQTTVPTPSGAELGRRVTVLIFGLIQVAIALRIVLLIADAREGNGLVSAVLNFSQFFVGPFEGVLHTNALHAGGSILDLAAIVALVGWTVLELIVLWVVGVFRRESA